MQEKVNTTENQTNLTRDKIAVAQKLQELEILFPTENLDTSRTLVLISAVTYQGADGAIKEYLVPVVSGILGQTEPTKYCLDVVIGLDNYDPTFLLQKLQTFPSLQVIILKPDQDIPPVTDQTSRVVIYDPYDTYEATTYQQKQTIQSRGKVEMLNRIAQLVERSAQQGYVLPSSTVMADHESHFISQPKFGLATELGQSQVVRLIEQFKNSNFTFLSGRTVNVTYQTDAVDGRNHQQVPDFTQPVSLHHLMDNLLHGNGKGGLRGPGYVAKTRELLALIEVIAKNHPSMKGEDTMIEMLASALGWKIGVGEVGVTNLSPDIFSIDGDGTPSWLRQLVRWMEGTRGIQVAYADYSDAELESVNRMFDKLIKFPAIGIAIIYLLKLTLESSPPHERAQRLRHAITHILGYRRNSKRIMSAKPHPTDDRDLSPTWKPPVST
jgi:hypothetical protein